MSIEIGTFEEFSMGANPTEGGEIGIDPKIIEHLVELVGSEEEVEQAAKEAFEELKKSFDENEVEVKDGDSPDLLAMSALVLKLVELGKLGPQEADSFIEENLVNMIEDAEADKEDSEESEENDEVESEDKESVNEQLDWLANLYKTASEMVIGKENTQKLASGVKSYANWWVDAGAKLGDFTIKGWELEWEAFKAANKLVIPLIAGTLRVPPQMAEEVLKKMWSEKKSGSGGNSEPWGAIGTAAKSAAKSASKPINYPNLTTI